MTDAARAFAVAAGLDLSDEQLVRLGTVFVEEWSEHVSPIEGVADMLVRLADRWTIGVVSNTHDTAMVPRMLREMGADGAVSFTLLSVEHGRLKPHPSIYRTALDRAAVRPHEAVFVGDNVDADYVGPRDAGMRALLIDPDRSQAVDDIDDIDDADRLVSVLDVEAVLAAFESDGT